MQLLQKLTDAVVNRRIRELVTPEKVEEVINDVLDLLNAGVGAIGLDGKILAYVESQLDKQELAAVVSARLLHLLVI